MSRTATPAHLLQAREHRDLAVQPLAGFVVSAVSVVFAELDVLLASFLVPFSIRNQASMDDYCMALAAIASLYQASATRRFLTLTLFCPHYWSSYFKSSREKSILPVLPGPNIDLFETIDV